MIVGTVVGNLWATQKDATLSGLRFLVVRPFTTDGDASAETIVAADPIGAGIGERVLVAMGKAARNVIGRGQEIGYQCAVVGIIDRMELADGRVLGPSLQADGEDPNEAMRK